MSVISLNNLNIFFKNNHKDINIVKNLNLQIQNSQTYGLVGESGCGKSITAYSIMGILPQMAYSKGEIVFMGQDLSSLSPEEMRKLRGNKISMIFQEPMTSLNPVLTIGNQISEVLITHKSMSKKDAKDKSVELLTSVKIPNPLLRFKDYPHQLSGGMRQRIMIAMAIACNPSLLIADEPTTALDVTIAAQILSLLNQIQEDFHTSILLITHDLGIISENTVMTSVMYAGSIVEQCPTAELFNNPLHPYTIGLLNSLPGDKSVSLTPIKGSVPRPGNLPPGCKFSDRCTIMTAECSISEPELKQYSQGHLARCIKIKGAA
ncbi:MAG: ABC transporter ATP-binding protein [Nitrospirae bacterium]|nr:ABC transporter ATP-binding protein [Nitrospirota bacterium]MBF0540720.1 ABC transporter ATP-binding protein [Nitrospirota bacterium]